MPKQRKTENYSDDLNYMADLAIELNMAGGQSKIEILDVLGRMKDNQPRMFNELQADISQEQIRKDRYEAESKERDKKIKADKSGNPSFRDRPKYKPKSLLQKLKINLSKIEEKEDKDKTKMIGGLSRKMNRGGLAKTGSADYRKKGLFY
tara:strand:- start:45 stop:494 length:450 start_codon:yes stop_codon:yes gene_type:complete